MVPQAWTKRSFAVVEKAASCFKDYLIESKQA